MSLDPQVNRAGVACDTAAGLRRFAPHAGQIPVMLGFDGFIDSIIDVVNKRADVANYTPIETIGHFGERITAAAGQSTNFELVVKRRKLGGNGPIMANAMAASGFDVTYIGALGESEVDPVFAELAERARVHSVLAAGATDALEFTDGKLLLGKYDHLAALTYDRLCQTVGEAQLIDIVARSRFIGMLNWTMLTGLETIWDGLIKHVLPAVPEPQRETLTVFIDLADPAKRTTADLQGALKRFSALAKQSRVVLGLNVKESSEVAAALEVTVDEADESALHQRAARLRAALEIDGVVVHGRRAAGASMESGEEASFVGPFVRKPYLSTGAGDNFNAGFCLGLLAELPLAQALCAGTATSGFYVRRGASPTLDELAGFCEALPEPEA